MNIKELFIGGYTHKNPLIFPNGILDLELGFNFKQKISHLPYFLRTLTFSSDKELLPSLPNTLLYFFWHSGYEKLPELNYVYILKIPFYTIIRRIPKDFKKISGDFDKEIYKNLEEAIGDIAGPGYYYIHNY
jgi:hypothetical protein